MQLGQRLKSYYLALKFYEYLVHGLLNNYKNVVLSKEIVSCLSSFFCWKGFFKTRKEKNLFRSAELDEDKTISVE